MSVHPLHGRCAREMSLQDLHDPLPALACLLSPACCPLPAWGSGHSQRALPNNTAMPAAYTTHFRWSLVFSVSVNFRLSFFGQSVLQSSALVLTEEIFPGKSDHAPLQLDCRDEGARPLLLGPTQRFWVLFHSS